MRQSSSLNVDNFLKSNIPIMVKEWLTGKENVCKLDIELDIELCQNVTVVHVYM